MNVDRPKESAARASPSAGDAAESEPCPPIGYPLFDSATAGVLILFGAWTLAYWITFTFRFASVVAVYLFPPMALILGWAYRASGRTAGIDRRAVGRGLAPLAVVGLGLVTAILFLLMNRPDADDLGYFHRALYQMDRLDTVFPLDVHLFERAGLYILTLPHLLTSYELGIALTAKVIGLDPLHAYQNIFGAIFAFWLPLIYFQLFLRFGLSRGASTYATLLAVGFLLTDGNQHAAQGNLAFVRLWQGKAVFFSLMLPLSLTALLEVLDGKRRAWFRFALVILAGAGLTGSAYFFLPLYVGFYSLAWCLLGLNESTQILPRLRRCGTAIAIVSSLLLVPISLVLRWVPMLQDFRLQRGEFASRFGSGNWLNPLEYALGTPSHWPFYAVLLILPSVWAWHQSKSAILPVVFGLTVLAVFNPIAGPFWVGTLVEVYWRLLYFFPFAIGAGLIAVVIRDVLARSTPVRRRVIGLSCLIVISALFATHFKQATFSAENRCSWKSPRALRFRTEPLRFSLQLREPLARAWILAPEDIVEVLPLLAPSARFESHRAMLTLDAFAHAGAEAEGRRRVELMRFLGGQAVGNDVAELLRRSLDNGFRAVVVVREKRDAVCRALEMLGHRWTVVAEDDRYTALRII